MSSNKPRYQRVTKTACDARAGCYVCHGGNAHWWSKNAQAVAARHTDATGHKTWVESAVMISYERRESASFQAMDF